MSAEKIAERPEPVSEGGFAYSDRTAILCRTCLRPLAWETRTEPGYQPRTGWYDDARTDPLICFKAVSYRHEPLTDREWAYYEAGRAEVRERVRTLAFDLTDEVEEGRAEVPPAGPSRIAHLYRIAGLSDARDRLITALRDRP